ncbi:hypothetical protein KBI52_02670 [Microvirga sp. HBU67558]|uniref:hypothetical protein n=1 Tax=Microvirga TaxID=186650 RepID=UPI001B3713EE|nr:MULTISPECIES: hypothetical protein [unclassified Microvirga]MBQ0819148.1 hypothetical protein [Microvirga sp. HBU67558]
MKPPFDLTALKAQIAARRDPRGPVTHRLPHIVTLAAPTNEEEQFARWDEPYGWCLEHVDHGNGHKWSRRRDINTGEIEFSFTDVPTGVFFALAFR